jgi:hypothetical protein
MARPALSSEETLFEPIVLRLFSQRGPEQLAAASELLSQLASLPQIPPAPIAGALATTAAVILQKETEQPSLRATLLRILCHLGPAVPQGIVARLIPMFDADLARRPLHANAGTSAGAYEALLSAWCDWAARMPALPAGTPAALLGHVLSELLELLPPSRLRTPELRQRALEALAQLLRLLEEGRRAFFLPGVASSLARLLRSEHWRLSAPFRAGLFRLLRELLVPLLSPVPEGAEKEATPAPDPLWVRRTEEWCREAGRAVARVVVEALRTSAREPRVEHTEAELQLAELAEELLAAPRRYLPRPAQVTLLELLLLRRDTPPARRLFRRRPQQTPEPPHPLPEAEMRELLLEGLCRLLRALPRILLRHAPSASLAPAAVPALPRAASAPVSAAPAVERPPVVRQEEAEAKEEGGGLLQGTRGDEAEEAARAGLALAEAYLRELMQGAPAAALDAILELALPGLLRALLPLLEPATPPLHGTPLRLPLPDLASLLPPLHFVRLHSAALLEALRALLEALPSVRAVLEPVLALPAEAPSRLLQALLLSALEPGGLEAPLAQLVLETLDLSRRPPPSAPLSCAELAVLAALGGRAASLDWTRTHLVQSALYAVLERVARGGPAGAEGEWARGVLAVWARRLGAASLVRAHADYLVAALSSRLRQPALHPEAPGVLAVLAAHPDALPAPLLEELATQLQAALDAHLHAPLLMRHLLASLNALARALAARAPPPPPPPASSSPAPGAAPPLEREEAPSSHEQVREFFLRYHVEKAQRELLGEDAKPKQKEEKAEEGNEEEEEEEAAGSAEQRLLVGLVERALEWTGAGLPELQQVLELVRTALPGLESAPRLARPLSHRIWLVMVPRFPRPGAARPARLDTAGERAEGEQAGEDSLATLEQETMAAGLEALQCVARHVGDFVVGRFASELWPLLRPHLAVLARQLPQPQLARRLPHAPAYRLFAAACRLVREILSAERRGPPRVRRGLPLEELALALLAFLHRRQPAQVVALAHKALLELARLEPDALFVPLLDLTAAALPPPPQPDLPDLRQALQLDSSLAALQYPDTFRPHARSDFAANAARLLGEVLAIAPPPPS